MSNRLTFDVRFGPTPAAQLSGDVIRTLAVVRRDVGRCDRKQWMQIVRARDPVEVLKRRNSERVICRAYYKMCEIHAQLPAGATRVLLLCEAPGGFWQALRRLHPTATLLPTSLATPDAIPFHAKVPVVADLPAHADVLEKGVWDELRARFGAHSCDLITADGGIEHEDLEFVEHKSLRLLIAQVACALTMQARGGSLVVKVFEGSLQPTRDVVSILRRLYTRTLLYKPKTSKAGNSERYAIAVGLIDVDEADGAAQQLARALDVPGHVHQLLARADADMSRAFDAMAATQTKELVDMIDVATHRRDERAATQHERVVERCARDLSWLQAHVASLASLASVPR